MRVLIFGAGALGSLFGAFLAGRHEVTLVGRDPHMEAVRVHGLKLEGLRQTEVRLEAKTALDGTEHPDLLLLTVKAHQTPEALAALRDTVTAHTVLLTAQNGLGNFEALIAAFPKNPVLAVYVTYGAAVLAPGRIAFNGQGDVFVGALPAQLELSGRIGRLLRESGFRALGVPDIRGYLWQKAIVNAAINPLSALTGKPNGELLDDPELLARMRRVVDEGSAVARALKVPLPERDMLGVVQRVARATAKNRSSMLEDLARGRRTEIDAINGAFVAEGKRLGIPTPENEALVVAIHERENATH